MGDSFAASFAANLASKLVESLVAPIGRHFGFVLCFKSYVEDLQNIVNELETARQRVQRAVQAAENSGRLILDHIEEWLNSVNVETQKAHNLLERGRSAENACFRGWLPNPVLRHPIGRKARRITKVIRGLIDKSQNFDLGNVSHERPPIGVVTFPIFPARSVDEEEDDLKSRASIKKKLLKALADDEVRVVGVWGAPGLGKSKLLDDIEKRVRMDQKPFDLVDWKPFDLVAMVKLSRNQDIRIIQDGIADAVGLHQMNEKTLNARACRIRERLENGPQKNILIIIDNLWEKLELKDVGIPCGDNNEVRGCKLLLSSRNRSILLDDMGCDPLSLFQLKGLEHDEARILFERIAGEKVNSSEFEAWVDGVVKNCGGLPLLIVSLAKKLKHRDLPAWRDASTNRDLSTIESQVESSYRDLKDERIRLLFLLCALGAGISVRISLLFCMGLGLLKKFSKTIENARDVLFGDLRTLQDSSLLLESQNTEWFRMHDIIVDVAISLRDKFMDMNWRALVWRKGDHGYKESSEDDLKNCTAISFCHVGIDELPEKLDCPNLRILLLFQGKQSLKISESFFDSTKMLQILVIIGLSFTSLPSSIAFLENLKSLSLDYCNLKDVALLGKLIRLQFLSLQRSTIARLPKEIGELTELRFLDLRMCFWLKVIDPGVLERLINLEELYMGSFDQWEAKDESPRSNASLIELKNMKKLRTLYISIPRWTDLSSDLPFGNLREHKIGIGGILDWRVGDRKSNILKLKLDSGDLLHEVWMQRCLQLTHDLHLEGSQDGEDSVHKLCTEGFEQLKHLCVQNNSTFKCIVDSTRCPAFTKLESLSLENLNGWENICRGVLAPESFSKLNTVKVENCGEIKHLFSSSMMRIFLQLEEIQISNCRLMEQIVADTEIDEDGDKIDDDPNLKSCKLRRLTLQNLPKMTSFYKTMDHRFVLFNAQQVAFPCLESLTLSEFPKLKEIWNSQIPSDVSHLRFLNIKDCAFLLSIFPSNLVIKLGNLEAIIVEGCQLLQVVFDLEGLTASGNDEILSRLTTLTLKDLPRLEHIWSKNPRIALCFQNLRILKVQNCEILRLPLWNLPMTTSFSKITNNSVIFFDRQHASFPRLESLTLAELPKLEEIWNSQYPSEVGNLKFLEVKGCTSLSSIIPSNLLIRLQNLEAITIERCQLIREVFNIEEFSENVEIMGQLTRLTLNGLPRLEHIWNKNPRGALCFQNLRALRVHNCENLRFLFSPSMAKALLQIKEIEVASCVLMEEIMDMQEEELEEVPTTDTLEFPLLNSLSLLELPNLKTFFHGKYYIHCPSLTKLTISSCPKMMTFASFEGRQESTTSDMDLQQTLDSINFGLSLHSFFNEKVFFPKLEELKLSSMCQLRRIWHNQLHEQSFCKLASLTVELCENLSSLFPSNLLDRLQSLNKTEVVECPSLEALFEPIPLSSRKRQKPLFFNALKKMKLLNLPRLTSILKSDCKVTLAFPSLMELNVRRCHSLTYLFSSATAKNLDQLVQLDVSCCNNLRGIIGVEEGEATTIETLNFQQLGKLKLGDLENLISFRSTSGANGLQPLFDEKLAFPKLEELHIEGAQQEDLWNDKILRESFCRLKILKVKQCHNLINVIPPFMWNRLLHCLESLTIQNCPRLRNLVTIAVAKNLGQLQHLSLGGCGEIEYIVAKEEETPQEAADNIVMSHLITLYLHNMPKLKSFYQENHISEWPALKEFTIENCKAVEVILGDANCRKLEGSIPMQRSLLLVKKLESLTLVQIKETEVASCVLMEEIMDMQEEESEEVPTTDNLEFPMLNSLSLLELPNLKTFFHGKYYLHCTSLTKLTISSCPKMMRFASFEGRQRLTTSGMGFQKSFDRINSGLSLPSFFNEKVFFPKLEELKLSSMCQLRRIWHDQIHEQSFCKLASLTIELCENLSSLFPSNLLDRLQSLNKTEVVGCASLEALFEPIPLSSRKRQKPLFFNALKKMKLLNLPRLTSILKSDCKVTLAFPSLMELNVRRCHSLTYLFSSATAKNLDQLVQLDVSCCNNLRGIIGVEEGEATTIETLNFQQLGKLKLGDLENLISFRSTSGANGLQPLFDEKLAFPKLEELHIEGAQQEDLWNDKILPESFCRLKILKVKQCHNLINVIPPFMWNRLLHCLESLTIQNCPRLRNLVTIAVAKNLGQLQHLSLGGCGEIEYIVAKEEETPQEAADNIVMSHLVTLYLHNMPKLKSFYQENHISKWPALKEFTIENCKAVEVILGDANCRKLEGSIPMQRPLLLVKKVEFPNMESMKISHMDNMKKIWLDDLASNAFSKLKTLVVEHCEKLPSIFLSHIILTRFQNLKELTVTNCESLEVVCHNQEFDISETHFVSDFRLRELVLKRLPKVKHVWSGLAQGGLTFGRLKQIKVFECENLKSLFPSWVAKSMTQLEDLVVQSCGVEEIIAEEDGGGTSASDRFFPQLTNLILFELPKLKSFFRNSHTSRWPLFDSLAVGHCGKMRSFSIPCEIQSCQDTIVSENQSALFSFEKVMPRLRRSTLTREDVVMTPQHYTFPNLIGLGLSCYHDENVDFPSYFLLHRFPNLEHLIVMCSSFEEIFPQDASGLGGATPCGGLTDVENPLKALANLERLSLYKLCNLRRVWKDGSLMAEILNQIESLRLEECPSLSIFFPSPISFQRLTEFEVDDCVGLVHVMTCSAATSLVHLESLTLKNCGAIEEVVTDDGNGATEISFPGLSSLTLDGLPSLESFSPTDCAFRFPSLCLITVKQCPKLNIFCKGALRTPELHKLRLFSDNDYEERWEGDLNTTIRTLST